MDEILAPEFKLQFHTHTHPVIIEGVVRDHGLYGSVEWAQMVAYVLKNTMYTMDYEALAEAMNG